MTPTPTLLLFVALFWTLPASAAVLVYRKHDNSLEKVKASVQNFFEGIVGQTEIQAQADA